VDPSAYAIERYGSRRNLVQGSIGELAAFAAGPFDLVVCIDVVPYLTDAEARAGIAAIGAAVGGVALIELFTSVDDFDGDRDGYRNRSPARYRRWFQEAGLERVGPNLFVPRVTTASLSHFERRG
jgi:predicted TPR repeat methyltransferase